MSRISKEKKVVNESTESIKLPDISKSKKIVSRKPINRITVSEYYDLPYRYNKTSIKLLAQSPNVLFAYWDISDSDKNNLLKKYDEDFLVNSTPVLIVHNKTTNSTLEILINDFANCWYINVDDTSCKFDVQLVRKYKNNNTIQISSSNNIISPNNHILIDELPDYITFENVKNGNKENISTSKFTKDTNLEKIYSIYEFYKTIYNDELLNNPSSKF